MNFFSIPLHSSFARNTSVKPVEAALIKHAQGNMLDIGCGLKPFYATVKDKVASYTGLEHQDSPHNKSYADVLGSADALPFEDEKFNTVLITQVIEHTEKPWIVFSEISRVLKRGGKCIVSWPFLYPTHEEPRDFFRYTSYGVKELAAKSNLEVLTLQPVSGFWITWFVLLSVYLYGKSKSIYLFLYPFLFLLKILCFMIQKSDRNKVARNRWTLGYLAVLIKEGSDA